MRRVVWAGLALASMVMEAKAQTALCDAVLNPTVFNIGETQNAEIFASKFKNTLCQSRWRSRNDVESRGSSFGFDVSYLEIGLGLNTSDYSNSAVLDQKYDAFCNKSVEDIAYSNFFFNKYRSSDFAVAQWSECVKNAEGHYALVVPDEGLTGAIVRLTIRTRGTFPPLKIQSVQAAGPYDVSCYYGSELATAATFAAGQSEVAISCNKRADVPASFVINTNWGVFDPIVIPGFGPTISAIKTDISETRARLQAQIDALKSRSVTRCQVCFDFTVSEGQCASASENKCSGWASVGATDPGWSPELIDNTDERGGWCTYKWRLICDNKLE